MRDLAHVPDGENLHILCMLKGTFSLDVAHMIMKMYLEHVLLFGIYFSLSLKT